MLIDENGVAIWVHHDKTGGAGGAFVCLRRKLDTLRLQLLLQHTHIRKVRHGLGIAIPTRVKGKNILLKHALEEADQGIAILHD